MDGLGNGRGKLRGKLRLGRHGGNRLHGLQTLRSGIGNGAGRDGLLPVLQLNDGAGVRQLFQPGWQQRLLPIFHNLGLKLCRRGSRRV